MDPPALPAALFATSCTNSSYSPFNHSSSSLYAGQSSRMAFSSGSLLQGIHWCPGFCCGSSPGSMDDADRDISFYIQAAGEKVSSAAKVADGRRIADLPGIQPGSLSARPQWLHLRAVADGLCPFHLEMADHGIILLQRSPRRHSCSCVPPWPYSTAPNRPRPPLPAHC